MGFYDDIFCRCCNHCFSRFHNGPQFCIFYPVGTHSCRSGFLEGGGNVNYTSLYSIGVLTPKITCCGLILDPNFNSYGYVTYGLSYFTLLYFILLK